MMEGQKQGVYHAIVAVSEEIGRTGIAKDRRNQQQGYAFRGIDDCYNALAPILAKHGLCILPCVEERSVTERETQRGGTLFYTVVRMRFTFVSAADGSRHDVVTYGEAMDSADKSTNKAMSAAYKYAVMQTFCIPTEGDNDADATTPPEVKAQPSTAEDLVAAVFSSPAPPKQTTFTVGKATHTTAGITKSTWLSLIDALKELQRLGQDGKAWLAAEGFESSHDLTEEQGLRVGHKALAEIARLKKEAAADAPSY